MTIEHVPLLQIERDLHDIPRGPERFKAYIAATIHEDQAPRYPPLIAMNPMGREHVPARLDEWLALDADARAAGWIAEAAAPLPGDFPWKHGLTMVDDLKGGWTNRWACEMALRSPDPEARGRLEKYGWLTTSLWVSEPASPDTLRRVVRETVARTGYVLEHGGPRTLGDLLDQEGAVARFAGSAHALDPEELEYSRAVLDPLRGADDYPTMLAGLLGDEAAAALGHRPLGLSTWAGLAVAAAGR